MWNCPQLSLPFLAVVQKVPNHGLPAADIIWVDVSGNAPSNLVINRKVACDDRHGQLQCFHYGKAKALDERRH